MLELTHPQQERSSFLGSDGPSGYQLVAMLEVEWNALKMSGIHFYERDRSNTSLGVP